ncbi:hypothetical protein [Opitutus terrae]|uniref:YqjK-like protein n=1 Tax=Opitutus terrae (strain DSM 11246 / JCM 15787 / PB90-1) TaxID=452637 RepID=B1ZUP8_OPITP|nr:hypothetical protein [Opitutus terrae]ACB74932.1 hypothetical protein Oter_1648 [Opitutus terrae PB90-1]
MYSTADLDELTQRKRVLQQQIALTREHCASFATEIARPLALIDRARAQWKRVSPVVKLATIPLALLLFRGRARVRARIRFLQGAWRWMPVVLGVARWARASRPVS